MKRLLLTTMALMTALPLYAELRTFKNTKGEEIKAEMVNATDSHVELKREDGRKFLVPLASLSEADRTWIAEWRTTHKHYKVQVQATVKKGNTREEKGTAFGGKDRKGNDCWYAIDIKNTSADALTGLKVEYVIFAQGGATAPGLCGSCEVAAIPAGKTGQALTQKLFVEQLQTTYRSGNSSTVQFSENSLVGIRAELFVDGRPAGAFLTGKTPADSEEQLKKWREKEQPAKEAAKPDAKPKG
jgi:hypothetical protein